MKKRYIKSQYDEIFIVDQIEKSDLVNIKHGTAEFLIDTVNGTYFDADENAWVEIKEK